MRPLTAETLLRTWDAGRDRHPVDRALVLFALADPERAPSSLADRPLGERNAALLGLRRDLFGPRLPATVDCPGCQARLELDLDVPALLAVVAGGKPPASLEVAGLRFRPPTSRDLAAIASATDIEDATFQLLRACLVAPAAAPAAADLAALLGPVEAALELADPGADVSLALRCDRCARAWSVPLDIPGIVWEELEAHAQRLLDEVHVLAQAYGWSEAETLGLSAARRAAYLERVQP